MSADEGTLALLSLLPREYDVWADGAVARLAEQRVLGGTHDLATAQETAAAIVGKRLPDRHRTPGQHIFRVVDRGAPVGHVWFSVAGSAAFVYDVHPVARSAEILAAVEGVARGLGARLAQINVFDHDHALDAATRALGYVPSATQMRLRIPASRELQPSALPEVATTPMTPDSFARFERETVEAYADDLTRAHLASAADAPAHSRAELNAMMPAGLATAGEHFLDVAVDGSAVATLWLSITGSSAFIADITVRQDARRRGNGLAVMLAAELYCADLGAGLIRLSVFGFNAPARALYDRLGYARVEELRHKALPDS